MTLGEDFARLLPIVAGPVSWPRDAAPASLRIDLGDHFVDLQGELVGAVLADCDGRTSAGVLIERHGEEAAELLEALLANGALIDSPQAWRTYHRQSSVGSALGRGATNEEILQLQQQRWMPAGSGNVAKLAAPNARVCELAALRSSTRPQTPLGLPSFESLSAILGAAGPANPASAGNMRPTIIHLLLREPLGPLAAGSWWLDAAQQTLRQTAETIDAAAVAALFVPEPGCEALLARGGPVIFLSTDVGRSQSKYGARAYRFGLIEVGAAMQSASLAAAESGVPLRIFGGIDDAAAAEYLSLPEHAMPLLAMIVG